MGLTHLLAQIRRLAADLLLDPIESTDLRQGLPGQRRVGRFQDLVELAPGVRPARRLDQWVFGPLIQAIESGIAIGLQRAGELLQVILRVLG